MGSVPQSPPGLWPQGSATTLSPPPGPFCVSPRVLLSCKNTVIGFRAHSVRNNLILACYICKDLFPSGAPSKALTVDLGDTLQPTSGEALVAVAACSFTCLRPPGAALLLPPTSLHLPGVA